MKSFPAAAPAAREEALGDVRRGGVVVAGDNEPRDARRRGVSAEARLGEGGGHRELGTGGAKGERGLDALCDDEHGAGLPEVHRAAVDAPERLAGVTSFLNLRPSKR